MTLSQYNALGQILVKDFQKVNKLKSKGKPKPKEDKVLLTIQGQETKKGMKFENVKIKSINNKFAKLVLVSIPQEYKFNDCIEVEQIEGLKVGDSIDMIFKYQFSPKADSYIFRFDKINTEKVEEKLQTEPQTETL